MNRECQLNPFPFLKIADFNRKDLVRHFRYYIFIESHFDKAKLIIMTDLLKWKPNFPLLPHQVLQIFFANSAFTLGRCLGISLFNFCGLFMM